MELDRITRPLRLARGSHQPGSGKGCAMNVISYISGDEQVTDFPTGSARPLSLLVQSGNDLLAGPNGYLSPENSLLVLDLAWLTVGTAAASAGVVHGWLAELLTNPTWGVLRYAKITAHHVILDVAALHRAAAGMRPPAIAHWRAARHAALAAAGTLSGAGWRAVAAAAESTRFVETELLIALDRVVIHAQNAHALASGTTGTASRITDFTGHAIRAWRELAGLDGAENVGLAPADLKRWRVGVETRWGRAKPARRRCFSGSSSVAVSSALAGNAAGSVLGASASPDGRSAQTPAEETKGPTLSSRSPMGRRPW